NVLLERDSTDKVHHQLTFIDNTGQNVVPQAPFQCRLTCLNLDVSELDVGDVRFCSESISGELVFYNVTSPTRPVPPEISSHHHWLIISHLSLSPLFLSNQAAVKQLILDLDIYSKQDLPKRKHLVRKLDGIKAITVEQADLVEQGRIIRGLKMVLQL